MYATDQTGYQTAYGGPFAGGDIATTIMPPMIPGYQKFDLYPAGPDNKGDVAKAKEALTACGQPNGFATNIAYRAERPEGEGDRRVAAAVAGPGRHQADAQAVTRRVTTSRSTPATRRTSMANKLGLIINGWGADWNDGFGFLSQIVDSRVIRETGGSSNTSVRIPEVDKMLDAGDGRDRHRPSARRSGAQIDKRVMEEAVILPGVYAKACTIRAKSADQRLRQRGLQHVRLPGAGRRSSTIAHHPSQTTRQVKAQAAGPAGMTRGRPPEPDTCDHLHHPASDRAPSCCSSSSAPSPSRSSSWSRGSPARRRRRSPPATSAGPPTPETVTLVAEQARLLRPDLGAVRPLGQGHLRRRRRTTTAPASSTARRPASATPSSPSSRSGPTCSTGCRSRSRWPSAPRSSGCVVGVTTGVLSALRRGTLLRPRRDEHRARRRLAAHLLHRPGRPADLQLQARLDRPGRQLHAVHRESRSTGPTTCCCPGSRWPCCSPPSTPGSPAPACSRR